MKSVHTKILSVALIFLFVSTNTLFLYPKKTEAQVGAIASCTAGLASAISAHFPQWAIEIIGVPAKNNGTGGNIANTAAAGSLSFNNCILKPLAQQMLVVLVRNIGASVVEWVNSGFEGKPLFVTDFEGLLTDTADGVIGSFIEGSELGWLCNDFSAQIRLSLALKYSEPTRKKFTCTLSDIAGNAENFLENNGGIGWNNWLELTTQPQNNVYGAYFTAKSELAQRVASKIDDKNKEVQRNAGFLNFTYCEEMESVAEAILREGNAASPAAGLAGQEVGSGFQQPTNFENFNAPGYTTTNFGGTNTLIPTSASSRSNTNFSGTITPKGVPQCKPGKTKTGTPGSIIGSKLSSVINQSEVQLAVAQEIDQVIGAVLNQLAKKAIDQTQGILGLSKKKSIQTGSSYLSRYRQELYGVNSGTGSIIIPATSEMEDYRLTNYRDAIDLMNSDPTTRDMLATTSRIANEVTAGQVKANEEIINNQNNQTEINTALLRPSSQSSSGAGNASNAVNGIKEGNVTQYLPPSITGEEQNPWWQTSLGVNTEIQEVRIWRVTNKPVSQTLEQIQVIVYDENDNQVWQSTPLFPKESSPNPIVVPVGVSGYSVRIQKYGTLDYQCREIFSFDGQTEYEPCYRPLELVEVEVIKKVIPPVTGGGFSTSTIPTNVGTNTGTNTGGQTGGVSVAMQSNSSVTGGAPLNYTSTISSASSKTGVKVITSLQTTSGNPVPLLDVFSSLDVYHGRQTGALSLYQISQPGEASFTIKGMSLGPNNGYRINLDGIKRVGVFGNYTLEVRVLDSAENILTTQRINFVVQ